MTHYRNRGLKPAAALWLFVLGADAAVLVAGAGEAGLWALGGAALVGAGTAGAVRRLSRRPSGRQAPRLG